MEGTATAAALGTVTVRAPAKVNLQLAVGARRADGYHPLASVFLAVDRHDLVTAAPGEGLTLSVAGEGAAGVPLDRDNLAARAATALAAQHGIRPDVHLHIDKRIPVAGGMAGGSADAAAALLACATLWETRSTPAELQLLAAELGSDVPFALLGGAALGLDRGDRLTPLPVTGPFHWALATADGPLPTPAVYAAHDRLRPRHHRTLGADPAVLAALRTGDPAALGAALGNDLQPAALHLRPALAATLRAGTAAGALGATVSGSGPTCAFLAADAAAATRLAAALTASGTCHRAWTATGPVPGASVLATPVR
ncbi:4-diphosphocytidyl-2-C-methyl-D-erythritol kinase [Kitasatospora phosalacinea]|uniref:4-diphosphocytidyl-2-C-methyl-D-erythritol kinase n=1 Tax=Kitasatospora phosalacinea TaxID=2065 RepID=A0A9W6QAF5_9ACTN|nr:4-(cytidine 5'-diphospho)-2-C-methyl-D-erythritol kinase [Kitasatospora phosalacinea]GLW72644.1 4-diphosphocytidyl-2-C-methyl-D-erythritol kinase [Kitasatospora phosalacinea]